MAIKDFFNQFQNSIGPDFLKKNQREVEDLICFHLQITWSELHLRNNLVASGEIKKKIHHDLVRLKKGEPLAYITGEKDFYKSKFMVTPSVLIPRPETELLVEESLRILDDQSSKVMDLGAGSGCIGLSIAKERENCEVLLFEASSEAFKVCEQNAKALKLTNAYCYHVEVGAFEVVNDPWKESVELIVSNPPYIALGDPRVDTRVLAYEPHQALFASKNGMMWIHKFLLWGYDCLKKEGFFLMEFGKDQDDELLSFIQTTPYEFVEFIKDYSGNNRFVKLKK